MEENKECIQASGCFAKTWNSDVDFNLMEYTGGFSVMKIWWNFGAVLMNFCCIFGAVLKLHNKNCINNLMKLHQNCIKNDAVFKLSQNCIRHASKFRQKNTKNESKLCQHFIKSVSNLNQSCFHFQSTWLQQFNSNIIAWYSDYVSSLVKCSL